MVSRPKRVAGRMFAVAVHHPRRWTSANDSAKAEGEKVAPPVTSDEFRNRPREREHARRQQDQLNGVGGSDTGVKPMSEDVVEPAAIPERNAGREDRADR